MMAWLAFSESSVQLRSVKFQTNLQGPVGIGGNMWESANLRAFTPVWLPVLEPIQSLDIWRHVNILPKGWPVIVGFVSTIQGENPLRVQVLKQRNNVFFLQSLTSERKFNCSFYCSVLDGHFRRGKMTSGHALTAAHLPTFSELTKWFRPHSQLFPFWFSIVYWQFLGKEHVVLTKDSSGESSLRLSYLDKHICTN